MNTKILVGVVLLAGVFALVAFFNKDTNDAATQSDTSPGETAVTIPENLPNNIPMYPESVLARSQESQGVEERNVTLSLETQDSVNEVNTWYRTALSSNDWRLVGDKNVSGYVLLEGENDNIKVFIQTATQEGKTVITQRIRIR